MDIDKIKLYNAIKWHLEYNFIPPYPNAFIYPIMEAVEAMRQGDKDRAIKFIGPATRTAWEIIEFFRLDDMIQAEAGQ